MHPMPKAQCPNAQCIVSPTSGCRPQHGASGSRKDLTGGRGTVEGHFTFTLVERAAEESPRQREAQRATAEMQREVEMLRARLAAAGGGAMKPRELSHVTLTLRGKDLAAMDINVFSKNSSDPYFILHARHADGTLHEVARSEVVPKNLSPQWLGLEVPFEKLRGATQLKVEVMDKDMGKKDDLIGTCTFDLLPVIDLHACMLQGTMKLDLPPTLLTDPSKAEGSKSRGEIQGSLALTER